MNTGFIAGGTMAEAILHRMLKTGLASPDDITVGNPTATRRQYLEKQYGIATTADNQAVIAASDLIMPAVKPQDHPTAVYPDASGKFRERQTLLSIVAGAYPNAAQRIRTSSHHPGNA